MARVALEEARQQVAGLLGTRPRQVIFTSGATEAINAGTFGALWDRPGGRVVVPAVEHSAVREASERWGAEVLEVKVDSRGMVDPDSIKALLDRETVGLVQCQLANHEVGTLQPIAEIAASCREAGVLLHVDAAAAAGHLPIAFDDLGADLMSVSAHKLGGPRGIGALLVRRGLRIPPLILGGSQERARRAGLENVAAAAGFGAAAAELSEPDRLAHEARTAQGRCGRMRAVVSSITGVDLYGPPEPDARLPHLVCFGVAGVEAEPVLVGLDQEGVAAHSGSSCASEILEPSPVLGAMGVDADHSLRLSVGWSTEDREIDQVANALPRVIDRLRSLWRGEG